MEETLNRNGTVTLTQMKNVEQSSLSWLDTLTQGTTLFFTSMFDPIVKDVGKNIERDGVAGTAWKTTKSITTDVATWAYNNPASAVVQLGAVALGYTNIGEATSLAQYGLPTSLAHVAVGGGTLALNAKTLVDVVDRIPDGKVSEAIQIAAYVGIAYYVFSNIPTATGMATLGTPFGVNSGGSVGLGTPTSVAVINGGSGQNIIAVGFPSSLNEIHARLFNIAGTGLTPELAVSTALSGTQTPAFMAGSTLAAPQGTFLAAWRDGATANVRIFDSGGSFKIPQTIIDGVNPPTAVGNPLPTGTADGNFKIGYIATNGGRIFYENSIAPNGTTIYPQTNLGGILSGGQYTLGGNSPLVNGNNLYCMIETGSNLIQDTLVTPSGSLVPGSGSLQLNQFTPISTPVCASLSGGTGQVVWTSGTNLILRNVGATGAPTGNEINLVSGSVSAPRIVPLKNDFSLVTYGLASGTTDFTGVILNANGANVTSPFTIAANTQGYSIAPLPLGTGTAGEDVAAVACYQETATAAIKCRTISVTIPPAANTTKPSAGSTLAVGATTLLASILSLFLM